MMHVCRTIEKKILCILTYTPANWLAPVNPFRGDQTSQRILVGRSADPLAGLLRHFCTGGSLLNAANYWLTQLYDVHDFFGALYYKFHCSSSASHQDVLKRKAFSCVRVCVCVDIQQMSLCKHPCFQHVNIVIELWERQKAGVFSNLQNLICILVFCKYTCMCVPSQLLESFDDTKVLDGFMSTYIYLRMLQTFAEMLVVCWSQLWFCKIQGRSMIFQRPIRYKQSCVFCW